MLSPKALKCLNSIEKISPRIVVATFNGNPATTVISCYSPTNTSDEQDVINFYDELSALSHHVPKHNLLVVAGDLNAQLEKNFPTMKNQTETVTTFLISRMKIALCALVHTFKKS